MYGFWELEKQGPNMPVLAHTHTRTRMHYEEVWVGMAESVVASVAFGGGMRCALSHVNAIVSANRVPLSTRST